MLKKIIPKEYLLKLESLLERVVLVWGFNLAKGTPEENRELRARHSRIQFLCYHDEARARFIDDMKQGREGLTIFVQIMEIEEVIQQEGGERVAEELRYRRSITKKLSAELAK